MPTEYQPPEGVPLLSTYYMYITGGCNLACRHCWIAPTFEKNGGTGQCLDSDLFKMAIEEAIPLGLSRIKFTGGEPLLHPDFVSMADFATEKELKTNLETNGTLLTRDLAFHLKEKTSLFSVAVSLDGATAATHDYMRNVPGSFELARRGVNHLVEAGYRPQIIMSLYPGNIDEIESLVKWAIKTGCGSVKFNVIQSSGRGARMKENEEILTTEQLLRLGSWIETDLQKDASIPLFFSWPMAFHGIRRLQNTLGEPCGIFNILGILSTGHVAMCGIGTQEKDLIYGCLGDDRIADIWKSSPALLRLRNLIPDYLEGVCSECIFNNRCMGACIAQNYYASGCLTTPFWFCRLADESGFFPSSRRREPGVTQIMTAKKFAI